jgi:hypothetical protein
MKERNIRNTFYVVDLNLEDDMQKTNRAVPFGESGSKSSLLMLQFLQIIHLQVCHDSFYLTIRTASTA